MENLRLTKGELAIILSRLKGFESVNIPWKEKVRAEQYTTDSEIASSILWNATQIGDINGMSIADLGSGTGILGFGALLLNAKLVSFIERDIRALSIAEENLKYIITYLSPVLSQIDKKLLIKKCRFIHNDINEFNESVNTVICNAPFGTKKKHADLEFLRCATNLSDVIYSIHKTETIPYIEKYLIKNMFIITNKWHYRFPLKQLHPFHKRRVYRFKVSCLRATKTKIG